MKSSKYPNLYRYDYSPFWVFRKFSAAKGKEFVRATGAAERQELWRVRRELSPSLKMITPLKFNHDVVVPKGRVPELFELVDRLKQQFRLRIPCFGHVGDGNIHVNIMEIGRAHV